MRDIKKWKQFLNEGITSKYEIGNVIFFWNIIWSYKENKNIAMKEKGEIVDIYDYDDENWGTLNVRVIPENKKIWDKKGGLWIGESSVISKVSD